MKTTRILHSTIFLIIIIIFSSFQVQQDHKVLFEKAKYTMETKADLTAAIDLFETLIKQYPNEKEYVAKSLLYQGLCFEKLGNQEAVKKYQQLVQNYSDQKNEVAYAKERLSKLLVIKEELNTHIAPKFTKIHIPTVLSWNAATSPDGQHLLSVYDKKLWITPITGNLGTNIAGKPVQLDTDSIEVIWAGLSWSADGKTIAFNEDNPKYLQDIPENEKMNQSIYIISANGGKPQKVIENYCGPQQTGYQISLSSDGKYLAYSIADKEKMFIRSASVDGNMNKTLVNMQAREPVFSPDGKFVAFFEREAQRRNLWTVPFSGGDPTLVAEAKDPSSPVWSPDAGKIAFLDNNNKINIISVDKGGKPVGEKFTIDQPKGINNIKMLTGWSKDNKISMIVSCVEYGLYTMPADGGQAVMIYKGDASLPRWAPDGKQISFQKASDKRIQGWVERELAVVPADGGESSTILTTHNDKMGVLPYGSGIRISPDGNKVVFSAKNIDEDTVYINRYPTTQIWTVNKNGSKLSKITNPKIPYSDDNPCWSPDGKSIAFIRTEFTENRMNRYGKMAIYIYDASGGKPRLLMTEPDEFIYSINWSPDGKWIAYLKGKIQEDQSGTLNIIDVKNSVSKEIGKVSWFTVHTELAWSPDSKRIAFNDKEGKAIKIMSVEDGTVRDIETGFADAKVFHLDWSPDGKRFVFAGYQGGVPEYWVMENFLQLEEMAEQHLKKGNELFGLWEYESAIEEYKKAMEPNPNSLLALNAQYCIGQTLFRQGKHESALETFKKLVEQNPKSNIAPVTELMISQVEHEMNEKKPIKKISVNEEKGTVLDSETGIEFRRIKTFTGNSDVIKWVPSTQLSPNGKFLLSDKTIVPMDGTPPFSFTDLNVDDSEWSPDGTKIAFRSDSSIYIMNIVSETAEKIEPVKKIFSKKCEIYGINWAPNSEMLYFSLLGESKKDYPEIYALNTSNGNIKQITNESIPLVAPGCSPDGRMLACTSIHSDLWLCPMDGGNAKQISDGSSVKYTGPVWTPDGKWIFSDETRKGWGRSLNFIEVENENEVKLTPPEKTGTWLSFNSQKDKMLFCKSSYRIFWGMKIASSAGGPSYEPAPHLPVYGAQWSTNSKMVIIQGEKNNNMEEGDAAIRIVPISGGESFLLNMDINVNGNPFAYGVTPNLKGILFVTKKDGDVTDDLYMAPISIEEARVTGPPIMIIENWNRNGAHNTKMSMSQDCTKLAIINNEDIWIYNLNNKDLKQITNSPEKKKWVAWSPDGSMISYQYLLDQPEFKKGSCIISSTDGKQINKIEDYLVWPYGWAPDSKSILYERDGKIINHNLTNDAVNVLVDPKSLGLKWIAQYFWSPDGKSMLFDARKENEPNKYFLYKYSLKERELDEIAPGDTSFKYDISWSPDGKWICYCYYEVEKYLPESTIWEADFDEVKEKLLNAE